MYSVLVCVQTMLTRYLPVSMTGKTWCLFCRG